MRLDPLSLPHTVSAENGDDAGDLHYTIDKRGVVIRRTLPHSGLPVIVAIPAHLFRGVAARAMEDESGAVTVTLELLHHDSELSVPVLVADDLDDIAADWRAWAEAYRLPMLLVEADGIARTLEDSLGAALRVRQQQERRQGKPHRQRRPRFLARRQRGSLGVRLVVKGREIISRRDEADGGC